MNRKRFFDFPCARLLLAVFSLALLFCLQPLPVSASPGPARCGKGFIEKVHGFNVLHLKGSPYEMGYQHGVLFKDDVRANVKYLLEEKSKGIKLSAFGLELTPPKIIDMIIGIQTRHLPKDYLEELKGLADGSGVSEQQIRESNFIPELFHCSGFAIMDKATKDGTLYHGRVLDYATDWKLQEHAVLIVAEPDGKIPFLNVTFAGFIGSVTGMNMRHVSIGEMGGSGLGLWDGVPMAVLVRRVIEEADSLDEAIQIFEKSPRTCEYYYVIADAKTNRAVGMDGSAKRFELIHLGKPNPKLPDPVPDTVLLSAGSRYKELVRRVRENYGQFDVEKTLRLMDRGVAMKSNLHNVLFEPKTTRFWFSVASKEGEPAATQPYAAFQLSELLQRRPPADSAVLEYPEPKTSKAPAFQPRPTR